MSSPEARHLAARLESARRDMALTERQLRDNGYHDWPDMIRISVAAYEDALAAALALDVEVLSEAISAVAVYVDNNEGILVGADNAESIAAEYAVASLNRRKPG